jgi:hypothetical protein
MIDLHSLLSLLLNFLISQKVSMRNYEDCNDAVIQVMDMNGI